MHNQLDIWAVMDRRTGGRSHEFPTGSVDWMWAVSTDLPLLDGLSLRVDVYRLECVSVSRYIEVGRRHDLACRCRRATVSALDTGSIRDIHM